MQGPKLQEKTQKKTCRFGQNCTRISTCEFLHKEQRRLTGTTDLDDLVKSQKALEKLIQSKDAEIKKLTLNIEKLETDIKDIQEDIQKFKTVEKRVEESEEKVTKLLSEIDYKVKLNFFINYQQLNIATTSDIDQVSIKLKPVLQELGFTKSCDNCPEVFKTDRQLRHHKKEKHTRDGRAGLFCHRAGLERAGLIFVQPGWAGAGWAGLATTHKNRAAGFFPSIN